MKRLPLILFFLVIAVEGFSQYDTIAPCLKTKTLPQFSLLSIDSVAFTQDKLDTGKFTILMLFNPECEHCQKQMERFLSMTEFYGPVQLVLISIETLDNTRFFTSVTISTVILLFISARILTGFSSVISEPKPFPYWHFMIKRKAWYFLNRAMPVRTRYGKR